MTYRGVEICFARSCKHQQSRVAFNTCFSCVFFVFTPTEFTVAELCDDNACSMILNGIVQPARSPIYTDSMSN